MNWTGGRLQRHSRTQDATKQRQKAYFAKSRQRPHITESQPCRDFIPDFLRPQYSTQGSGTQSQGGYLLSQPIQASQGVIRGVQTRARPKLAASHRRHAGATPATRRIDAEASRELHIDLARRRLLRQADWAGLDIIRPLSLDFQNDDRHDLGKRRHISRKIRHERTEHFEPVAPPARLTRHPREQPMIPIPETDTHAQYITVRIGSQARSDGHDLIFSRNRFNSIVPGDSASQAQPTLQCRIAKVKQPRHHRGSSHQIKNERQSDVDPHDSLDRTDPTIVSISDNSSEEFTPSNSDDSNLFDQVPPPRVVGNQRYDEQLEAQNHNLPKEPTAARRPQSIGSTRLFVSDWPDAAQPVVQPGLAFTPNREATVESQPSSSSKDFHELGLRAIEAHNVPQAQKQSHRPLVRQTKDPNLSQTSRAFKTDVATYRSSPRSLRAVKRVEMSRYESSARITRSPGPSLRKLLQVMASPKPPKLPKQTVDALKDSDAVWRQFILGSDTESCERNGGHKSSEPKIAASSMWVQPSSKDTGLAVPEMSTEKKEEWGPSLDDTTKQSITQNNMQLEASPTQDRSNRRRQTKRRKRAESPNSLHDVPIQPGRSQRLRRR